MENLKKELQQAIMERFKQSQIAKGLEKRLAEFAEEAALEKYKGTKVKRGKWEYELLGIKAECDTYEHNYMPSKTCLSLTYMVISELTKEQKAEVKKGKNKYENHKYIGWCDEKKFGKLWFEESYSIEIDLVIKKVINLEIKGKIV